MSLFAFESSVERVTVISNTVSTFMVALKPEMPEVSPLSGKLPRRRLAEAKEGTDQRYAARMAVARKDLATEMLEVAPESLATLRLKRGLSQVQLAKKLDTSQPHIARIEAGKTALLWTTATRLADALGVSLDELRSHIEVTANANQEPQLKAAVL